MWRPRESVLLVMSALTRVVPLPDGLSMKTTHDAGKQGNNSTYEEYRKIIQELTERILVHLLNYHTKPTSQ